MCCVVQRTSTPKKLLPMAVVPPQIINPSPLNMHMDSSDASTTSDITMEVSPLENVDAYEDCFEDALSILEQIASMLERIVSVIREHR